MPNLHELENAMPVAPLGIIALESMKEMGQRIDEYIVHQRHSIPSAFSTDPAFGGYLKDSYLIKHINPRFGSGEGKGEILESVRGKDLYILVDICNHSLTYKMNGYTNYMSPDAHYQDLKRVIAAIAGKARRITVIMTMLYEGRQHKRTKRESLDCAVMLQELIAMGVTNFLTFDAHDPRINNAIPLHGFDNVQPTYQMIKALVKNIPDLVVDKDHLVMISPDEGAMQRCIYYSSVLGVDIGMFYKRRNYSVIIDGKNPIEAHEYLGQDLTGKDVIIVDDMISSGESMFDVAKQLKQKGAKRIFNFATFGLFTNGFEKFDKAYEDGIIDKIFTTNLVYHKPELETKPWWCEVNMCKYVSLLIDTLNHDDSIGSLLDPIDRIENILKTYNLK